MLMQIVSLLGALMILGAYLAIQQHWLVPESTTYNLLNLVGASLLGWVAVVDGRVGFIILEVVWALAALPPLLRALSAGDGAGPTPATGDA